MEICSKDGLDMVQRVRKEVYTDASKWTQQRHARNREGLAAHPTSQDATAFCLLGAGFKVAKELTGVIFGAMDPMDPGQMQERQQRYIALVESYEVCLRNQLQREVGFRSVVSFNDHPSRRFEEVTALLDHIIEGGMSGGEQEAEGAEGGA